jgi:hypothetical protein
MRGAVRIRHQHGDIPADNFVQREAEQRHRRRVSSGSSMLI